MTTLSDSDRMKELQATDEFYCSMMDLVPPDNFGFDEEIKEKLRDCKHKLVDRKLKNYEQKRLLVNGRQVLSRLNFDQPHTVTDMWAWLDEQGASNSKDGKKAQGRAGGAGDSNKPRMPKMNADGTLAPTVGDGGSSGKDKFLAQKQSAKRKSKNNATKNRTDDLSVDRRAVLVQKLQNKLKALAGRKTDKGETSIKQERNLLRKIKRLGAEGAKLATKSPKSGAGKNLAKGQKSSSAGGDVISNGAGSTATAGGAKTAAITNSQGQVVFSKFDFAVSGLKDKRDRAAVQNGSSTVGGGGERKKFQKHKNEFGGKDFKTLLGKVEDKERRLADLKQTDPEKAARIEDNQKWDKALEKSQGLKIKDDKKLLKMNMKRKDKQKATTKEEWKNRQEKVQAKIQKKQEQRTGNLKQRSDDKKQRKIDKARKKGRIAIP